MKNSILLVAIIVFVCFLNFSCEKDNDAKQCYSAKILKISCGGTVLQLLQENNLGEEWRDADDNTLYSNCVLAETIPSENKMPNNTIYIEFEKVNSFSTGNFCDIGGLPSTKIEIKNVYNNSCLK